MNAFYKSTNITFSGGYKLELLDPTGKLIQTLTPEQGGSLADGWIDDDATAQRHLIKLPDDKECLACTVSKTSFTIKLKLFRSNMLFISLDTFVFSCKNVACSKSRIAFYLI